MLEEYLCPGPRSRVRYWQKYKERMWRLCGSKAYRGQREKVMASFEKRRKKYGQRALARMLIDERLLPMMGQKDLGWNGGALIAPFRSTVRVHHP